jgi:hypothetical protein
MNSKLTFTSRWAGVATLLAALALPSAALASSTKSSSAPAVPPTATTASNAAAQSNLQVVRDREWRRQNERARNKQRHQAN